MIWAIPTQLLATEYLQIDIDIAKTLYSDLSFYKLDTQHKTKQISLLELTNEKLLLYNVDLLKLNNEWKKIEINLEDQIIKLDDNIINLDEQLNIWKTEAYDRTEDLEKCLNKPWFYIHFPSVGYGVIGTLLLILAL